MPARIMGSMKRVILSIAISAAFLAAYLAVSAAVVIFLSPGSDRYNMSVVKMVQFPVTIPNYIYYQFFPPTAEDFSQTMSAKKAVIATAFLLMNIVLYTIPVYIILSIVAKFRKKKLRDSAVPPSPPQF